MVPSRGVRRHAYVKDRGWRQGDANPRPLQCGCSALPAELCPHGRPRSGAWRSIRGMQGHCQTVTRPGENRRFPRRCHEIVTMVLEIRMTLLPWLVYYTLTKAAYVRA